jgi:hypothetical protein
LALSVQIIFWGPSYDALCVFNHIPHYQAREIKS